MWLYMIALFLLAVAIIGGIFSGGIFTIVLLPLGVIVLISAIAYGAVGHAAQKKKGAATAGGEGPAAADEHPPLPRTRRGEPAAPSTPDDLADARRFQQ